MTVSAGAMDCTGHAMGISKIVNSIILPLAGNGVSLFCMSTYQGDFILVNKCLVNKSVHLWDAKKNFINLNSQLVYAPDFICMFEFECLTP